MSGQFTVLVTYRPVEGFPGYRVGDDGSVWTEWGRRGLGNNCGSTTFLSGKWTKMNPTANDRGYLFVSLKTDSGKQKNKFVHRLVLEMFVGPCPKTMEARHFPDGSPLNNALSNLAWGTKKENANDKETHGNTVRGEKYPGCKMTDESVREMRLLFTQGWNKVQLANKYGVSHKLVRGIIARKKWKHVG